MIFVNWWLTFFKQFNIHEKKQKNKWHGSTPPLFCPSFPCGVCLLYGAWNAHILPTCHRTWHVWKKHVQGHVTITCWCLFNHCLFRWLPVQDSICMAKITTFDHPVLQWLSQLKSTEENHTVYNVANLVKFHTSSIGFYCSIGTFLGAKEVYT